MQKKKKKTKLFIFLIICFVLVPFLLTKGCNYMESLIQAENSLSEPISSISEQIQPSASVYTHAHERAHTRTHNAHVYAQMHSISKANWTGTAVPNSGYVENVYLNTTLSVEEVVNIIKNANLEYVTDERMYIIISDVNDTNTLVLSYGIDTEGNELCLIANIGGGEFTTLFQNNPNEIEEFEGWNPNINNIVGINENVSNNYNGFSVGAENSKLSALFSITPFEQSSSNELSIGNLFAQLGNAIIIFGGAVVNVFISMEPIFWNEGPTLIFILLIASVSFALVFWGIELLISLIGVFKTKRKKKKWRLRK